MSTPVPRPPVPRSHAPDAQGAPQLVRSRRIAWLLVEVVRVPGTSWRLGIDPLLGLVPGAGDWVSWAVGLQLVWSAARMGAGPGLLLRMSGNLVLDAAVGTIPALGTVFDLAWKANTRNLELLEELHAHPERTERGSRWLVGSILGGTVALLAGSAWVAVWVLRTVVGWLF